MMIKRGGMQMARYENPTDVKIYDNEQIKEWARRDIASGIEEEKARKKRRQAIISGAALSPLYILLIYTMWKFMENIWR